MAVHVPFCSLSNQLFEYQTPQLSALKLFDAVKVRNLEAFPISSKQKSYFTKQCSRSKVGLSSEWRQIKELKAEVRNVKLNVLADERLTLLESVVLDDHTPLSASKLSNDAQVRNIANFPVSKWKTYFTKYCSINNVDLSSQWRQIEELKAEVRIKLNGLADESLTLLTMIDAIQQLGLGYQFQAEIDRAINLMYTKDEEEIGTYDLFHTSLYFRLLRQHGYNVSSSVFKKFIDTGGCGDLKEEFARDVVGMVSFYEAVQLRVTEDGEILDEDALARCVAHLQSLANNLSTRLKTQVTDALNQSIHKDVPWFRARKYIETYQENEFHDPTLLTLAKLHFNVLQKHHQQELSDISKRWNDLDIASKCPYSRDRHVESYIWALSAYYEPHFRVGRKMYAKFIALFTVIDDTYDAYGTADELALLTESITRGDTSMFEQLPAYARELCQILLDFYAEIEEDMANEGRSFAATYLIKWMKLATTFYYQEYSLWLDKKQVPSMEEYRRVAFASINTTITVMFTLAGLGSDVITEAAFEWVSSEPDMVVACQVICRFQDDIGSHEFEQEREHVPSAVECYMNEYGVSREEACKELSKEISDAWKVMNEGCMKPTPFPFPVHEQFLNSARLMHVFYTHGDSFTNVKLMEDRVLSLLVHPVPI